MTNVDFTSIFHFESSVFHDAVFVTDSGTDSDCLQVRLGHFDGLEGTLRDILAYDAVAVACVDHNMRTGDSEFFFCASSDGGKVVVWDMADFTDRDGIDADEYDLGVVVLQDEGFCVERVVDGAGGSVGDLNFCDSGF